MTLEHVYLSYFFNDSCHPSHLLALLGGISIPLSIPQVAPPVPAATGVTKVLWMMDLKTENSKLSSSWFWFISENLNVQRIRISSWLLRRSIMFLLNSIFMFTWGKIMTISLVWASGRNPVLCTYPSPSQPFSIPHPWKWTWRWQTLAPLEHLSGMKMNPSSPIP